MSDTDREAGFTLMETLIGMLLTALIAIAISATMRTAVQVSSRMAVNDELMEVHRVRDWVSGTVARALPEGALGESASPLFLGKEDQLIWTVEGSGRDGAKLVQYELAARNSETCPSRMDLMLYVWEFQGGVQAVPAVLDSRLLLPCSGMPVFEYSGPDGEILRHWQSDRLPRLVRLSVEDHADWLVVRPIMSGS